MIAVDVVTFGLAWWLGLYVLVRNPRKPLLRRAGLGLLLYALALAAATLSRAAGPGFAGAALARLHWLLIFFPALLWSGALLQLLPEAWPPRAALDRGWRWGCAPLAALVGWLAARGNLAAADAAGGPPAGAGYALAVLLAIVPLAGALGLVLAQRRAIRPSGQIGLLLAAGLFFGLGVGLLLFPLPALPHAAKLLMIETDLVLLGIAIALFDALDEGETLRRDILRSAVAAGLVALLFGAQVALAGTLGAGAALPMRLLLLAVVALAIALATCADPLTGWLDRLVFAGAPALRRERAELRGAATALSRQNTDLAAEQIDEDEFARLTRRALSHYGDLARLASSPLTQLPLISQRLAARGAPDDALERAAELKMLLAECVARLKPRGASEFGTSDEWRYYNALFFPYMAGLKPYSRRADLDGAPRPLREAFDWFRAAVPERTLYNWQSAGARLIARDLRARATAPAASWPE
ncbi:hypothetical protein [Kouleothrix sp.]|uniref:hypothetical protein n=1 Tax=Kouleothrix sp. TaxID=2779161 RepID=UPI003918D78C